MSKLAKSTYSLLFVALAFLNGLQYHTSDFQRLIYNDLATSCKHLVNVDPVTPEFKRVKGVHPSSISSLATFSLLLDLAGISTEFFWGDFYSVMFHLCVEGVTAMPCVLHAGLCCAFLV